MSVVIGSPTPCSGAFDCLPKDMQEVFVSPASIIGVLAGIILLILLWVFSSKREFKTQLRAQAWAVASVILAMLIGLAFYSPIKQYDNLKGQYDDAIKREQNRKAELEAEQQRRIALESMKSELESRLDKVEDSIKQLLAKTEEILRNLPKPKAK